MSYGDQLKPKLPLNVGLLVVSLFENSVYFYLSTIAIIHNIFKKVIFVFFFSIEISGGSHGLLTAALRAVDLLRCI